MYKTSQQKKSSFLALRPIFTKIELKISVSQKKRTHVQEMVLCSGRLTTYRVLRLTKLPRFLGGNCQNASINNVGVASLRPSWAYFRAYLSYHGVASRTLAQRGGRGTRLTSGIHLVKYCCCWSTKNQGDQNFRSDLNFWGSRGVEIHISRFLICYHSILKVTNRIIIIGRYVVRSD